MYLGNLSLLGVVSPYLTGASFGEFLYCVYDVGRCHVGGIALFIQIQAVIMEANRLDGRRVIGKAKVQSSPFAFDVEGNLLDERELAEDKPLQLCPFSQAVNLPFALVNGAVLVVLFGRLIGENLAPHVFGNHGVIQHRGVVEVTIGARTYIVVYPVLFLRRVVVEHGEAGTSLLHLVEIILGGLHSLVYPKNIGRETVELLLVIEADKPKCPVLSQVPFLRDRTTRFLSSELRAIKMKNWMSEYVLEEREPPSKTSTLNLPESCAFIARANTGVQLKFSSLIASSLGVRYLLSCYMS